MRLLYKQLNRQLMHSGVFVILLLSLTALTSLSFFFVRFSIDGNMAVLAAQASLSENQVLYQNALQSNASLAYTFLVSLTGLTAFVFVMFFYRFFRANKKQIGCLKALGFRDSTLRGAFVSFSAALSAIGALSGLVGGYFLSGVLLNANMQSYQVAGLVKAVTPASAVVGLGLTTAVFCVVAFLCYAFVGGKSAGTLMSGNANQSHYSKTLRFADAVSNALPIKNKFGMRIALRKPVAVVLVFVAVMCFSVCMVLGRSLNISSQKIFDSQTAGRQYTHDIHYDAMQPGVQSQPDTLPYLELPGTISFGTYEVDQNIVSLYSEDDIFTLQDGGGAALPLPQNGKMIANPGLAETYGLRAGDTVSVTANGRSLLLEVAAIAGNARSASIYMNATELTELSGLPTGSHNGLYVGDEHAFAQLGANPAMEVITREQQIDSLRQDAVSNNVSAVINQVTGAVVGCILLFLALYMNFQDNTRDMLILSLMGYRPRDIRKLLVNVYFPIVWAAFFITLAPSILLARGIQRSLSISINDFMPFGTSIWVLLLVFALLNVIYLLVQATFGLGVRRILAKEDATEYTSAG